MEFDYALAQDIGTRSEQQDSAAVCPFDRSHGALLVIADGLGGHTGGARASHIVVKTFADAGESGRFKSTQDRYEQLGAALHACNTEIATAAQSLGKNETMGTTLVAAAAAWNTLGWISVGDSHLYLWRAGKLTKLNEDHSQAGQMVKSGNYAPDDPELDAYRSMLRSAIMGREMTLIDRPIETYALERDDVIVLATDGLNVVETADVERIVAKYAGGSADAAANALLDAVRDSGAASRDNATVIVARVTALDRPATVSGNDGVQDAAHEQPVTTAIVTTPFFKTGQPPLSSAALARQLTQPVIPEADALHLSATNKEAARPGKARSAITTSTELKDEVPARRWILPVAAFFMALLAGAAALAYQRGLLVR